MAFDLERWKGELREGLRDWPARMKLAGVTSVYSFLSASALWPVVEALGKGEYSAMLALAGVAGSVGTNLLANRIEAWRGKAENDVAGDLERAPIEPELREALDAILNQLGAIEAARAAAPPSEWERLVERLVQELREAGSGDRFDVTVGDHSTVAVGTNAIALARGATLVHVDNIGPGGRAEIRVESDDETSRVERARAHYLERLIGYCTALPLPALGGKVGADEDLSLDDVYVQLDTTTRIDADGRVVGDRPMSPEDASQVRALSALEAAGRATRLAIVGGPGSGKSTFVKSLLVKVARAQLGRGEPLAEYSAEETPVLVTLRELSDRLLAVNTRGMSGDRERAALAGAVRELVEAQATAWEAPEFATPLGRALTTGKCLLVLDGLDEVPEVTRPLVRKAVDAVLRLYRPARVVVTCRTRSYQGETQIPDFDRHELAPFDDEKIEAFVRAWYRALEKCGKFLAEDAHRREVDLIAAAVHDPKLRELAENPMMLTSIAIIHRQNVTLPRERVRVYALLVDLLLRRWEAERTGLTPVDAAAVPDRLTALLAEPAKLREVVEELAFAAHGGGASGALAELTRSAARELLERKECLGDVALAEAFLSYIDFRAGLLSGLGGEASQPAVYRFPHQTLQEYLAGCRLLRGLTSTRVRQIFDSAKGDERWRIPVRFAAEELLHNTPRNGDLELIELARSLAGTREDSSVESQRARLWAGEMVALLGAERVASDTSGPVDGAKFLGETRTNLVRLLGSKLGPIERADAGVALARIGDPRIDVTSVDHLELVEVPAGQFLMGESFQRVDLPRFWISKFPITNAQYGEFVDAGGYDEGRFWSEAIADGVWQDGEVEGAWAGKRRRPAESREPFGLPNHPVVGITWYEALAFTRWLTKRRRALGKLEPGFEVRLPSEAEWEKAARGGVELEPRKPNEDPKREYPWRGDIDPQRANYGDTGIGATSAVGCFPGGASPYGIEDLSGNVWEWTRSAYRGLPYDPTDGREKLDQPRNVSRVLRGGSYFNVAPNVRVAARYGLVPDYLDGHIGFRVIVSSPSDSGP